MEYYNKCEALKKVGVIFSKNYNKYFIEKCYKDFLERIKSENIREYCEHISNKSKVNIFLDIDIKENLARDKEYLNEILEGLNSKYPSYMKRYIILSSHSLIKKSYHVIVRMCDSNGNNVYFENVECLKKELLDVPYIDNSVYRDGLFRTIYSSKKNENRPLIRDDLSDDFDDIESFVCYTPDPYVIHKNEEIPEPYVKNEEIEEIPRVSDRCELTEQQVRDIVNGLDIKRCENRESWLRIGYFLCKYSFGVDIFLEFSQKSDKYCKERHFVDWESIKNGNSEKPIKVGTLLLWLKEDNKVLFDKIVKNSKLLKELNKLTEEYNIKHTEIVKKTKNSIEAISLINKTMEPVHNMISKNCEKTELFGMCCSSGYKLCCRNCDFKFPDKWIEIDKNNTPTIYNSLTIINNNNENINNKDTYQVAMKIKDYSDEKILYTENYEWYIYNEKNGIYEKNVEIEILNKIEKIVEELKVEDETIEWYDWFNKISYKENVIKELKSKFFKKVKFDNNDFLLGFENGVYDLNTFEFRKGAKNEYITMKCGVAYNADCDTSLVDHVINGIYPIVEEREFALNILSLCLEGYNREQKITFNYGYTASNGKSYIMERMCEMMGDYGDTFPVSLLTSKPKGAGEANSTLMGFKDKRFMYCSEPDAGSKLNTNFIKLLTGDIIKARGLYKEDDVKIRPTYKMFVNSNTLPNFDAYDEGISRRIRLLEYKSKFVENPRYKNEKKLIKYSSEQDTSISSGLLKILLERYQNLKQQEFKYLEPESLASLRKMYINDNKDVITNVLRDSFELGEGFVKMPEIKSVLKNNSIKEKDIITIRKIIEDTFPGVEYKQDSSVDGIRIKCFFTGLKRN
jgi:P4 family phage/plasmid primase-like protien